MSWRFQFVQKNFQLTGQADGGVRSNARLFVAHLDAGEVLQEIVVQVVRGELRCEVQHALHGLLAYGRIRVEEALRDVQVDLVHGLRFQVFDVALDVRQQLGAHQPILERVQLHDDRHDLLLVLLGRQTLADLEHGLEQNGGIDVQLERLEDLGQNLLLADLRREMVDVLVQLGEEAGLLRLVLDLNLVQEEHGLHEHVTGRAAIAAESTDELLEIQPTGRVRVDQLEVVGVQFGVQAFGPFQ